MPNPYRVLGVGQDADDATIRRRYLELTRRFPPERDPETSQSVRKAYEAIADVRARMRMLLFEPSQGESLEEWIEEIECEQKERRLGLEALRQLIRKE